MCGLPYSGKTTLAKKLSEQKHYALIAYDTLWQEVAKELGKPPSGDDVLKLAEEQVMANLTNKVTTVYDTLHGQRDWRDRMGSIATSCNSRHLIVYLKTPPEVLMERFRTNAQTESRHQIKLELLESEIRKFEPPQAPEHFVEFTPKDELEKWVREFSIE